MSSIMNDIKELQVKQVRSAQEVELAKLTDKQRHMIQLSAEMPYNPELTVIGICNEVGITKPTYYAWKSKYADLIGSMQTENMSKLRPKILESVAQLLHSSQASNVKVGAELLMRLEAKAEQEANGNSYDKQMRALVVATSVIMQALDVKDLNDATTFVRLFAECAVDHMVRQEVKVPNMSLDKLRDVILEELAL